ncbi:MAG: outer membrane protein transport protein [Candidatus Marithrix sp.]|nr:outer membrane protein transport protein [Candidatus Marithrix sp.]
MKLKKIATIIVLSLSSTVYATNGYWSHGYGAKSKAMAGACVAMSLGAMCSASNPASLVRVGNRMDYGLSLFTPTRGFTANDDASPVGPPMGPASIPAGKYESGNDFFLIPHFAYNYMLDNDSSLGVAVGGNGGMNTEYDRAVFQNFGNPMYPSTVASSPTGIDLTQMFIGVTYSRKINEQHSFGITPVLAIQSVAVTGLEPFTSFSLHPDKVTNNGHDFSYGGGLRFGWMGQITDRLTLGASYQTKLKMTNFDEYKGLFAEEGNFDVPANYDLGFAFKVTPKLIFAFDYQWIEYSGINSMSNPADLVFMPGQTLLGTENGLGFGWEDMDIFKFGLQWQYSSELTLRMGYSHSNNPFPNSQALFNTLAPAVVRDHYTFGFSAAMSENTELNVGIIYAPNEKIHGDNRNTGPQTGFIEMKQFEFIVGWGVNF